MNVSEQDKRRAACFDIKVAWLAISRMYNAESTHHGITTNIGYVLLHVDESRGTPATKIASLMGMESRSLTRTLNAMEARGMIERKTDPYDRRMIRIFLTAKGKEKKALAEQVVINFNQQLYRFLKEEEVAHFFNVLDTIHQVINNQK